MKILIFLIFCISSSVSAQYYNKVEDSISITLNEKIQTATEFNLLDDNIKMHLEAIKEFYPAYEIICNMDKFPNKETQRVLIKDYAEKYYNAFNSIKNPKDNSLRIGFKTKSDLKEWMHIVYDSLRVKAIILLIRNKQKFDKKVDLFINENLKKIKISRDDFDKMSEKDRKTLVDKFE